MNKKQISSIALSIAAAAGAFGFAGCGGGSDPTDYNIIMAHSTNPAVMATIDCVKNGNPTYAWFERKGTFGGLTLNSNFTKSSNFDTAGELNQDVISEMGKTAFKLIKKSPKSKINIYVTDFHAIPALQVAYQAGLSEDQFHIYLIEDGAGAYSNFNTAFVSGSTYSAGSDGADAVDTAYTKFTEKVSALNEIVEDIKEAKGVYSGDILNYSYCYAAATLPNVTYWFQDTNPLKNYLDEAKLQGSKMYDVLHLLDDQEDYTSPVTQMNLKVETQAHAEQTLTEDQKTIYGKMSISSYMFDMMSTDDKKLVIAGTSPTTIDNRDFIPDITVEALKTMHNSTGGLKEPYASLLNEDMYNLVIANLDKNGSDYDDVLNMYLEYAGTMTAIQKKYGQEYTVMYKDHPKYGLEDSRITASDQRWTSSLFAGDDAAAKGTAMFNLVNKYYKKDTYGKEIKVMESSTNIATYMTYFDMDLCGWDSSFYCNAKQDQVKFLFDLNNEMTKDAINSGAINPTVVPDNDDTWFTQEYKIDVVVTVSGIGTPIVKQLILNQELPTTVAEINELLGTSLSEGQYVWKANGSAVTNANASILTLESNIIAE